MMSKSTEFTVSPARVKAGEQISVLGRVGPVSRIWIKETGLTAFAVTGGVGATVTDAVPPGGWQVSIADPDGIKTPVGVVIVDQI